RDAERRELEAGEAKGRPVRALCAKEDVIHAGRLRIERASGMPVLRMRDKPSEFVSLATFRQGTTLGRRVAGPGQGPVPRPTSISALIKIGDFEYLPNQTTDYRSLACHRSDPDGVPDGLRLEETLDVADAFAGATVPTRLGLVVRLDT